jgi:hypothetical protein
MKRKLLLLLIAAATMMTHEAAEQEVYKTLRQMAIEKIESETSAKAVKEINTFKLNALNYLAMKMREEMPDSTIEYLDKQALAMHDFVNLYTSQLVANYDKPQAEQTSVVKIFIDASLSNPLFNDSDTALTQAYVAEENSLTRFSLDTDWQRAFIAAAITIKKKK